MEYLWTDRIHIPEFPQLDGDISTDVLIIGGGMAGVLCAKWLEEAGVDYVLTEAKTIGWGITKGTTAVLSAQHDILYQDIVKHFNVEKAQQYLDANLAAVQHFRTMCEQIDCDFENRPSIMYSLTDRAKMENEVRTLHQLGYPAEFTAQAPLPLSTAGAVVYPDMAQFHPLKFLCAVARGRHIYEHTFVRKLEGTIAMTSKGQIRAKRVIIATHFPFINSRGLYYMKLYQQRSYIIAYEGAPDLGYSTEDESDSGFYMRSYQKLLLIGGGDHRTGKKGGGYTAVDEFANQHFTGLREKYRWSNQDCITLDTIPYIGRYSATMPNVYVATGFNHWGMSTSMAAAEILSDMVRGKENPNAAVFAPDRNMLRGRLFSNLGATLLDFITPTVKRCSHLGCALKWNPTERSWDCPCHGSRFDEHGKLIDNPAMKDSHVE